MNTNFVFRFYIPHNMQSCYLQVLIADSFNSVGFMLRIFIDFLKTSDTVDHGIFKKKT